MRLSEQYLAGVSLSWLAALTLLARAEGPDGLFQTYCSTQNTASQAANTSIYQSNGYCFTRCKEDYAFAVVQYNACWCSDYIPAEQTSVSECNEVCPGYKEDLCGNIDKGLFGYIALPSVLPSGTAGAATSAQPPSTSVADNTPPTSVAVSSIQSSPPSGSTATPVKSIEIVTVSGAAVTKTVTSTPIYLNGGNGASGSGHKSSLSGGDIAGIVVGVVGGIAAILAIAFFVLRRRGGKNGRPRDPNKPTRTTSVLSRTGLLTRHRVPSMAEKERDDAFHAHNSASARHSGLFMGLGDINVQPASPLGSIHGESDTERRNSRPMVYDQRLNPSALFANAEANGSRVSMQDQHDYSRPLGIANPDPRPSFESRRSRG